MNIDSVIKNSFSINDVSIKLYGYTNGWSIKKVKKIIYDNCLDISHFSFGKKNRKYERIIKICPICNDKFETLKGHKKEKTTCSSSCSNKYFQHGQNNPSFDKKKYIERYNKVSNTLSGKIRVNKPKKYCPVCNKDITNKPKKQIHCSTKCKIKNGVSDITKKRISDAAINRIKNGKHKGWQSRNIESYPEKFFKKVLKNNGIKYEFNKPIKKSILGINCHSCYFLDFYIERSNKKIDLEIDGSQHNLPDRIKNDKLRNDLLIKNGFIVYRIKWKSLNNNKGKKYIKKEIKKFLNFYNLL